MISTTSWADRFTLIIPTYNRPAEFSRLLDYLARHRVGFRLLVLDSSESAIQETNKIIVQKYGGNCKVVNFDSQIVPWEKFWRGSEMVETEYCSLCADDDLVVPESLQRLTEFLREHRDYSVAHGWYFTFYDNIHIGITASVYRGASLDQGDPLDRLFSLFKNYEAVTYGVYCTYVMQSVLRDVQGVNSLLARELLGGALAITQGKVARLPIFYYGRSLAPSQPYNHWHPLDFLISSPDEFYRDYSAYREILLNALQSTGYDKYSNAGLITLIDLIHFRYLSDYVKPRVMEYLTKQIMARKSKPEIMRGVWSVLAAENDQSIAGALSGSLLLRRIRDRFFPGIKLHHFKRLTSPSENRVIQSKTVKGNPREYLFYKEFLASFSGNVQLENEIGKIVAALDYYI